MRSDLDKRNKHLKGLSYPAVCSQSLARFDEKQPDEATAVFNALGVIANLVEVRLTVVKHQLRLSKRPRRSYLTAREPTGIIIGSRGF